MKRDNWNSLQQREADTLSHKYKKSIRKQVEMKQRRAVLRGNWIYLFHDIKGEEYKTLLKIPGRELSPELCVPCNLYTIGILEGMGFKFSENIYEWKKQNQGENLEALTLPEGLKLYPYQTEGVKRIHELGGRCLLADAPRLGKTIQIIAYLIQNPQIRPALIVVPASVKIQWKEEINKWMPAEKCFIVNGRSAEIPREGIVIINYDVLHNYYCDIEDYGFKIIVGDECHKIKNPGTNRTKAFRYLARGMDHIIGLSGTPINNRPLEFFTMLNMLDSQMFSSREKYMNRYCGLAKDPSGKGASNTKELHEILKKSFMIRRLRSEVWTDIPDKQRIVIPVEIENREEYEEARRDLIKYLRNTKGDRAAENARRSQALARFNVMKDIAARGKLKQAKEWIEDYIHAEKLVVFCNHRSMVEELNEHFKNNSVKLYGGMSDKKKNEAVKRFNDDPKIDLFVGNLLAAGVGIPLHIADATLTLELGWVPADHEQAEDRVINKEKHNVPIAAYYIVAKNTIEEEIAAIIDRKAKVLSRILDGQEAEEDVLLTFLINKYTEED
jgi:SWI/SNF-related matrix-associated actin-dependent regulator 1 of chromatin subfamily A